MKREVITLFFTVFFTLFLLCLIPRVAFTDVNGKCGDSPTAEEVQVEFFSSVPPGAINVVVVKKLVSPVHIETWVQFEIPNIGKFLAHRAVIGSVVSGEMRYVESMVKTSN